MGLPLWFTNPEGSKFYYQGWVITHRLLCHSDDFIIISKHDRTSCFIFYRHKKKEKGVFLSPTLLTFPTVVVGALLQYFTGESLKEILQNLLASSVHRMLFLYKLARKKDAGQRVAVSARLKFPGTDAQRFKTAFVSPPTLKHTLPTSRSQRKSITEFFRDTMKSS